jgi:hypothetical protein
MLRRIIIPTAKNHSILLPESYYGKRVIVTVSALDENVGNSKDRLTKAAKARAFFNSFQIDITGFKFDREEANER